MSEPEVRSMSRSEWGRWQMGRRRQDASAITLHGMVLGWAVQLTDPSPNERRAKYAIWLGGERIEEGTLSQPDWNLEGSHVL